MAEKLTSKLRRIIHSQHSLADLARHSDKSYITIHSMLRRGVLPKPDIGAEGKRKFYSQSLYEECLRIINTPKLTIRALAAKVKISWRVVQRWIQAGVIMGPDVHFGEVKYYSQELFKKMVAAIKQAKAE